MTDWETRVFRNPSGVSYRKSKTLDTSPWV